MDRMNELEYQISQLMFEKENLKRQLTAAMKLNKKMYEQEVNLKQIIETLKKQLESK